MSSARLAAAEGNEAPGLAGHYGAVWLRPGSRTALLMLGFLNHPQPGSSPHQGDPPAAPIQESASGADFQTSSSALPISPISPWTRAGLKPKPLGRNLGSPDSRIRFREMMHWSCQEKTVAQAAPAEVSTYCIAEEPSRDSGTSLGTSKDPQCLLHGAQYTCCRPFLTKSTRRSVAQTLCALATLGVHHCPSGICTYKVLLWSKVMSGQLEGCRHVCLEVFRALRTSQRAVLIILSFRR